MTYCYADRNINLKGTKVFCRTCAGTVNFYGAIAASLSSNDEARGSRLDCSGGQSISPAEHSADK